MANPFDISELGAAPETNGWRSLMLLGANMAAAANARNGQGFLTYGNGFAGPLGAAVGATAQQTEGAQKLRSQLALQREQIGLTGAQADYNRAMVDVLKNPPPAMDFSGMLGGGSGPGPVSSAAPTGQTASTYEDAIFGREGAGNNPRSSASGYGQFTNGTFNQFLTANQDRYGWMTPEQRAGLRNNPDEMKFATAWLAKQNAPVLLGAGVKPSGQALGMAHYLGPQAAAAVMKASDDQPIAPLLVNAIGMQLASNYVQANPELGKITAGDLKRRYANVPDPTFISAQHTANGPVLAANSVVSEGPPTPIAPQMPQGVPQSIPMGMPGGGFNISPQQALQAAQQANAYASYWGRFPQFAHMAAPYTQMANQLLGIAFAGPKAYQEGMGGLPAKIALEQSKPADLRPGQARYNPMTGQWIQSPIMQETVDPRTGARGVMPITPAMPGESPNFLPTHLAPSQESYQKEQGQVLAKREEAINETAAAAVQNNFLVRQMFNDSKSWDMGKFADFEGNWRAYLSAFGQSLGIDTPGINKSLGDYQAFQKNAMELTRQAVRQTSSRAAVQEFEMIQKALPSATMSREGFQLIGDQLQAINNYAIAKQRGLETWKQSHPSPDGFEVEFNSKVTPTAFLIRQMESTPEGQRNLQNMLANMAKTPEGKIAIKKMMAGYQYANDNKLFGEN